MKKCSNCANRKIEGWMGYPDYCLDYEMADTDEEEIETAEKCSRYVEESEEEERYCPSSTGGDYGPGNPWDAPGMSIRDFI